MTLKELGITEPCEACKGTQMQTRYDVNTGKPHNVFCPACAGVGEVLSEEGKKLAGLLARRNR